MKDQNNIKAFHTLFGLFMCSVALVAFLCNFDFGYKDVYRANDTLIKEVIINHISDFLIVNWKDNDQTVIDLDRTKAEVDSSKNVIRIDMPEGKKWEIKFINE